MRNLFRALSRPLAVLSVLALIAISSLALADYKVLGTYNTTGVGTGPSGSTAGLAIPGDPSMTRRLQVIVSDVRDGSVGDGLDVVSVAREEAWCYSSSPAPDGGGSWVRAPEMDIYLDAGAVSGVLATGAQYGLAGSVQTTNGIPCARIYYNTATLNLAWDAGTGLVHQVTVFSHN